MNALNSSLAEAQVTARGIGVGVANAQLANTALIGAQLHVGPGPQYTCKSLDVELCKSKFHNSSNDQFAVHGLRQSGCQTVYATGQCGLSTAQHLCMCVFPELW